MAHRKGDRVTVFAQWDLLGTVRIYQLTVYSCGAKRMVLMDDDGNRFQGAEFSPDQENVVARLSDADAITQGIARAASFTTQRIEHYRRLIGRHADRDSYIKHLEKEIEKMHEPRIYQP